MLGNLISAIMLTTAIGIGGPLNTSTDYQDVNVTETYEYETNEVNNFDDLIDGNIYKFNDGLNLQIHDLDGSDNFEYRINDNVISHNYRLTEGFYFNLVLNNNSNFEVEISYEQYVTDCFYYQYSPYVFVALDINFQTLDFDITINSLTLACNDLSFAYSYYFIYDSTNDNQNFISSHFDILNIVQSDYLGEKNVTVTPIEYDGMFAIFTNFLYSRLFSGDVLTSMQTTILGQTLTLGQWVSSSVAIVILCLIVFLLVKFVIFLFKVVGGAFLWK